MAAFLIIFDANGATTAASLVKYYNDKKTIRVKDR